ncbi:MAG: aminoacyltransferase [Bacilli bacterium]|jgi:serine/alanine adding enzyme|nr:aminoacyltransferase [Bacilli bacterium]
MELEIVQDLDKFNDYVLKHQPTNIMQTSYWAQLKNEDWQAHYLFFKKNQETVGSALLLERKAFLSYSFFYCSRGMITDFSNEEQVKKIITLIKNYTKKHHGFVCRFDPEIAYSIKDCRTLVELDNNKDIYKMLNKYAHSTGLSKSLDGSFQPRYQMVVNLKNADLKNNIKPKKRRLVNDNYLKTRGFEIIDATNPDGIKEFARLSHLTEIRQGIALRNEHYFMKMYDIFKQKHFIKVFMAQVNIDDLIGYNDTLNNSEEEIKRLKALQLEDGNIINTNAIICLYGTNMVQMFYGASDERFAKYKAGYKLHFQAMEDALEHGYDNFNLGGVAGTLDDGLFKFKTEFHPELWEYLGDFDIINNKFIYFLFEKALPIFKKIRKRVRNNGSN